MSNFNKYLDNISPEKRLYLLKSLPSHLADAGLIERFQRVLTDFEFMEAKVSTLGPQSLINDYELSNDATLRVIQNALRREAHVLIGHPNLLFQQIYNRLQWERDIDILSLTTQRNRPAKLAAEPWLHLVTPLRESRALIRTFSGHGGSVNSCAFAPDGKSIISVSRDRWTKIWETQTGREMASFSKDHSELTSCVVSPDGTWIVTGSRMAINRNIDELDYVPDDIKAALKDTDSDVEVLRIWDADTYRLKLSIGAHGEYIGSTDGAILDCAVSPDGKLIASASEDQTIKLWDAISGREVSSFKGHEGGVWGCVFSPDGALLVSASEDGTLMIWDVSSGKIRRTLRGHNDQVTGCDISHDGKQIVSSSYDGTVRIWNLTTGNQELQLNNKNGAAVFCCAFGPDDSWVVTGDANWNVEIWDLQSTQLRANLYGHTQEVVKCAVSPDGGQIISASYDHTLKLWDVNAALNVDPATDSDFQLDRMALAILVSPKGQWVLSRTRQGDLKQWETRTGRIMMVIPGSVAQATSCDLSPDGKLILAAGSNGRLCIWDSTSGSLIRTLWQSSQEHEKAQPENSREKLTVTKCRFSADGTRIVASTSEGNVIVWDVLRNKEIIHAQIGSLGHWAVNPSANILIYADGNPLNISDESNMLQLWSLKPGNCQLIKSKWLGGEVLFINDIAVSPVGDIFATATAEGSIILWNLTNGSRIRNLRGHESGWYDGAFQVLTGGVLRCAFSCDGQRLVSIANYREVKVWDIQNAKCLATMYLDERLYDCAWHPDGKQIILGGMNGEYVFELLINQESHKSLLPTYRWKRVLEGFLQKAARKR